MQRAAGEDRLEIVIVEGQLVAAPQAELAALRQSASFGVAPGQGLLVQADVQPDQAGACGPLEPLQAQVAGADLGRLSLADAGFQQTGGFDPATVTEAALHLVVLGDGDLALEPRSYVLSIS